MPTTRDLHILATHFLDDSAFLDDFDARLTEWLGDADDKLARIRALGVAAADALTSAKAHKSEWDGVVKTWSGKVDYMKALAATLLIDREALGEPARVVGVARLQGNGGVIPVIVDDETAIPLAWRQAPVTPPPDLDRIRTALEAGEAIPGVRLGERGRHVKWE